MSASKRSRACNDEQPEDTEMNDSGSKANKSRQAAKGRRDREHELLTELGKLLPFPEEVIKQLDKATILRVTISYLMMKNYTQKDGDILLKELQVKLNEESNVNGGLHLDEGELMLGAMDAFLIFITREGRLMYISDNVSQYLGFQQTDMLGHTVFDFIHQGDRRELVKQFCATPPKNSLRSSDSTDTLEDLDDDMTPLNLNMFVAERGPFYLRMKFQVSKPGCKTKHNGIMLTQWSGRIKLDHSCVKEDRVKILGLAAIVRPMQSTSILEIRMDGNMFTSRHDLSMKFTFCDPRILTLVGYDPSELIGKTAYQFHNPLDAPKIQNCHSNLIDKGQSVSKYYRFLGKTGEWVWMQTRATIICNSTDDPQYVVCMNYVISQDEGRRYLMMEEEERGIKETDLGGKGFVDINSPGASHSSSGYASENENDHSYSSSRSKGSPLFPTQHSPDCLSVETNSGPQSPTSLASPSTEMCGGSSYGLPTGDPFFTDNDITSFLEEFSAVPAPVCGGLSTATSSSSMSQAQPVWCLGGFEDVQPMEIDDRMMDTNPGGLNLGIESPENKILESLLKDKPVQQQDALNLQSKLNELNSVPSNTMTQIRLLGSDLQQNTSIGGPLVASVSSPQPIKVLHGNASDVAAPMVVQPGSMSSKLNLSAPLSPDLVTDTGMNYVEALANDSMSDMFGSFLPDTDAMMTDMSLPLADAPMDSSASMTTSANPLLVTDSFLSTSANSPPSCSTTYHQPLVGSQHVRLTPASSTSSSSLTSQGFQFSKSSSNTVTVVAINGRPAGAPTSHSTAKVSVLHKTVPSGFRHGAQSVLVGASKSSALGVSAAGTSHSNTSQTARSNTHSSQQARPQQTVYPGLDDHRYTSRQLDSPQSGGGGGSGRNHGHKNNRNNNSSSLQQHISSGSVLETLLLSDKKHDAQKGSDAAVYALKGGISQLQIQDNRGGQRNNTPLSPQSSNSQAQPPLLKLLLTDKMDQQDVQKYEQQLIQDRKNGINSPPHDLEEEVHNGVYTYEDTMIQPLGLVDLLGGDSAAMDPTGWNAAPDDEESTTTWMSELDDIVREESRQNDLWLQYVTNDLL